MRSLAEILKGAFLYIYVYETVVKREKNTKLGPLNGVTQSASPLIGYWTWNTRVSSDSYIAEQEARYRCVYTLNDFVLPALAISLLATVGQTVSVVMVMVRGKDLDDLELLLDMKHGTVDQEKLEDLREMVRKRVWPSKMIATAHLLLLRAVSSGDLDFIKFYDFISRGDLTRALTGLRFAKEEDLEVYETLICQHLSHKPDKPTPEELKTRVARFKLTKNAKPVAKKCQIVSKNAKQAETG